MTFLFLFLLFYLPFQIALNPAPGIDLASGRLFILILFLFWLGLGFFKKKLKIAVNFQSLSFLLFLAASVFSLAAAQNIGWGLRKIAFFLTIFPVYFLASEFLKTDEDLKSASKSVSAAVLIASLFGIFQFFGQFIFGIKPLKNFLSSFVAPLFWGAEFGGQVVSNPSWFADIGGETYFRAISFFPDPHIFAFYLALALPFIAASLLGGVAAKLNKITLMALICGTAALFLTFSRGAYLGFSAALIFILFESLASKRRKKITAVGLAVLIVSIILLNFNNPISQRFYATFNLTEGSNTQRIAIWKEAFGFFKQNPLFGIGIGNYALEKNILSGERDPSNAHNLYLDIAAETGILGLAAWLILIFGSLYRLMKNKNSVALDSRDNAEQNKLNYWRLGLAASLIWFSVHSFFETAVYSPVILPLLLIIFAAAGNLPSQTNQSAKMSQNSAERSFLK
ncbi:MAG: O-antigen ligase family protein [Patescibacteria group bacterium]